MCQCRCLHLIYQNSLGFISQVRAQTRQGCTGEDQHIGTGVNSRAAFHDELLAQVIFNLVNFS